MNDKREKCGIIGLGWWGKKMCEDILESGLFDIKFVSKMFW